MREFITVPADPQTPEHVAAIVKAGVRDLRGAAAFIGRSRSFVCVLISRGELWSYRSGGKRFVPVVELRRWLAAEVMDSRQ